MGTNKPREIQFHPILNWYFQQIEERLALPDTRLTVIGYSFRDEHVNQVIIDVINQHDPKLFVCAKLLPAARNSG